MADRGRWSLIADIGPLLFTGAAFAYGAEGFTNKRTGMATRRAPIAFSRRRCWVG